jgi:Cu2+-containing amine oxidase
LRFQEALRGRGLLADVDNMRIDPWTVGDFGFEEEQGRRVLNSFVWMRTFPLDNYYAYPVEWLHALIDLCTLEIARRTQRVAAADTCPNRHLDDEAASLSPASFVDFKQSIARTHNCAGERLNVAM